MTLLSVRPIEEDQIVRSESYASATMPSFAYMDKSVLEEMDRQLMGEFGENSPRDNTSTEQAAQKTVQRTTSNNCRR